MDCTVQLGPTARPSDSSPSLDMTLFFKNECLFFLCLTTIDLKTLLVLIPSKSRTLVEFSRHTVRRSYAHAPI